MTGDCRDIIQHNYLQVKTAIKQTSMQLVSSDVKLLVVSKFQSAEKIRWLLEAGQRDFGESRIEEVEDKWEPLLMDYPETKLHFIGPIQSKKIRKIVKYTDYIHSVDRLEVAEKIAKESQTQNKSIKCFIQINIGAEAQKAGIAIEKFPAFFEECKSRIKLLVVGIMCIPPIDKDPIPYFRSMRNLQLNHGLKELSMGMSNDYKEAINCGATIIRVGSKILGSRAPT